METTSFFGAGGATDISWATLALALIAVLLIFILPRPRAIVPLLLVSILVPIQQQVVIAGIHLPISRLLILAACIRVIATGTKGRNQLIPSWSKIDSIFVAYCVANVITYFILWGEIGALINRLGFLYNSLGMYFLVRHFVRSRADLDRMTKVLILGFTVVAVGMVIEQATGRNYFSVLGGVPLDSVVRDGKIRAQGCFVHPLTAGAIGATLLPLAIGQWWQERTAQLAAVLGICAAVTVSFTSRSSTPLLVLAAGFLAFSLWPLRRYLARLRLAILFVLILLHIIMKAPVWALIARIDLTGSSSGFHRYILLDQFIRRFGEWWLIGTRSTATWGWDMWDSIDSYVSAGTSGGVMNFVLFVAVIVVSFRQLRKARRIAASDVALGKRCWVLSALLFSHAIAFFGIAYFDQSQFVWFAELGMISTAVLLKPSVEHPDRELAMHVSAVA